MIDRRERRNLFENNAAAILGLATIANLVILGFGALIQGRFDSALMVVQTFVLLETGIVVAWYTVETYKLRLAAQAQLRLAYSPAFALADSTGAQNGELIEVKMFLDNMGSGVVIMGLEAEGFQSEVEYPRAKHGNPIAEMVLKIRGVPKDTQSLEFSILFRNSLGVTGKDQWVWRSGRNPLWNGVNWL